jgi:hypothetical protein
MLLSYLLVTLSGFAKGIMDLSSDGKLQWKPADYWLKSLSWERKYKSKIPFATTIMVWTTDAWHLFQMIFLINFSLGFFLFPAPFSPLHFVLLSVAHRVAFEGTYRLLQK